MAEKRVRFARDQWEIVPSSDNSYIVNEAGLLSSRQISVARSIDADIGADSNRYLETHYSSGIISELNLVTESTDIYPSAIQIDMRIVSPTTNEQPQINISLNGGILSWSDDGSTPLTTNFITQGSLPSETTVSQISPLSETNRLKNYAHSKLNKFTDSWRFEFSPQLSDIDDFRVLEMEIKFVGDRFWDNHSDVPGHEAVIYRPTKITTDNNNQWVTSSGTPLIAESVGDIAVPIEQNPTVDELYIRHIDEGHIIQFNGPFSEAIKASTDDFPGATFAFQPSGGINIHFNADNREPFDNVSRAILRIRTCPEPYAQGTTLVSDNFTIDGDLTTTDNYLGGATTAWSGDSSWAVASGFMYNESAGDRAAIVNVGQADFRAIADIVSGSVLGDHGLVFKSDELESNQFDQSYRVTWNDLSKSVDLISRTTSDINLDTQSIVTAISKNDLVRTEVLVRGSGIQAIITTPSGESFYLEARDNTHLDHTYVGHYSSGIDLPDSSKMKNLRVFNSNNYRNELFGQFQVHGFNPNIERAMGWDNPNFDRAQGRSNGYILYGELGMIWHSGFKTFETDLVFLDPLKSYDDGNYDLSSPYYKTIEAFQNLEINIPGPPSGMMISSVELEVQYPTSKYMPLFTLNTVQDCTPWDTFPESGVSLNGLNHFRGNYPVSELFDNIFYLRESSGTTINSSVGDATGIFTDSLGSGIELIDWNVYEDGNLPNSFIGKFQNAMFLGTDENKYFDFDNQTNVVDNFTYYFQIAYSGITIPPETYEGNLLWRGTLTPDESELYIYLNNDKIIATVIDDLNMPVSTQADFTVNSNTTGQTFFVSHRLVGGGSGVISIYDDPQNNGDPSLKATSSPFIRKKLIGDVVTNLGGGDSSHWTTEGVGLTFPGFLTEFGVSPSAIVGNFGNNKLWIDWWASYRRISPYLGQDPQGAGDGTKLTWNVRNPVTKESTFTASTTLPNPLNEVDTVPPYQLGPIQSAYDNIFIQASAIYLEMDVEVNTNHPSGVTTTLDINFNSGSTTKWKVWEALTVIPSSSRQTLTLGHHDDLGFDQPMLWTDVSVNSPWLELTTTFPENTDGYYGEVNIYSVKMFFDSWCIPGTGSDELPLFVNGTTPTANNNLDLFLLNTTEPGDVDLFIHGFSPDNNQTTLFIAGSGYQNALMPLFIHGITTNSGSMDLYISAASGITNIDPDPSGVTLFVDGILKENKTLPLFIEGLTPGESSGNFPLWVWGMNNPAMFDTTPLFAGTNANSPIPQYTLNLFTTAPIGVETSNLNLFLGNDNSEDQSLDLFLNNTTASSSSNVALFIGRPVNADGSNTLTSEMNLFISRDSEAVAKRMPLFLQTAEQVDDNISMFVFGSSGEFNNITMFISGQDMVSIERTLYSHGF